MTLKPVTEPIFKAHEGFNEEAARQAYELVSKMDPDTAEMFVHFVVSEVLEDTISKNRDILQRHLNAVIAKRTDAVRTALVRKAADDPETALPYAQAFSEITKKTPYDYGYQFKESDFNRDPSTGRFKAKVSHSQKKPFNDRTAQAMGIPKDKMQGLDRQSKAQFQDEYRQIANFLGAVQQSSPGGGGNTKTIVQLQNKQTGQRSDVMLTGTNPGAVDYNPNFDKVVGLQASPETLNVGGAAFSLQSALGRGTGDRAGRTAAGLNAADREFGSFAQDWSSAEYDPRRPRDQVYNRVAAGSALLGSLGTATGSTSLKTAGAFGQFVGEHGSEAEAVFGPPTQKMAYRYRGTEKNPDREMVSEYGKAVQRAKLMPVYSYADQGRGDRPADKKNQVQPGMKQLADSRQKAQSRPPTMEEREEGRDIIIQHLMGKAPKASLFDLHLEAGNTPPSEGVLLNRDGQIVTQAVGYGDDHYLPFNLKNIKDLKGGEYIRTRSLGGLTSEDIHVGLMSGARKVTVVSRSGVFTVNFNDDFRGGRRHNDKAKRMTRRYEALLDAVQSEQVSRKNLDPKMRKAIERQVQEEYGDLASPLQLRDEVNARVENFKRNPVLSEEDQKLEDFLINTDAKTPEDRVTRNQARSLLEDQKEYYWKLNGRGYEGAQKALQEQFPYYITTNHKTLWRDEEPSQRDKGYVQPGRNRPRAARAGLNAKGGKISTEDADYQGQRAKGGQKLASRQRSEGAEQKAEAKTPAPADKVKENIARVKASDEAAKFKSHVFNKVEPAGELQTRIQGMDDDQFKAWYTQPGNAELFDTEVKTMAQNPQVKAVMDEENRMANYLSATGKTKAVEFDPALASNPNTIFSFTEKGYQADADPADKIKAADKIDQMAESGIKHSKPLTRMTAEELDEEIRTTSQLISYTQGMDKVDLQARQAIDQQVGVRGERAKKLYDSAKAREKHLEAAHRAKALFVAAEAGSGPRTLRPQAPNQEEVGEVKSRIQAAENTLKVASEEMAKGKFSNVDDEVAENLRLAAADMEVAANTVGDPTEANRLIREQFASEIMYAEKVLRARDAGETRLPEYRDAVKVPRSGNNILG